MYKILLSIYLLILTVVVFLITTVISTLLYPFVTQKIYCYINDYFGSLILKGMTYPGFWTFKITDLRKDKSFNNQYVIVGNHVSFIDSILLWELPIYKKFMMAKLYSYIPIFGQVCSSCGHVMVDDTNTESTSVAVEKAYETIGDGSSIVIFPEGQRSKDNILLPFKTGAFRLAQKANIPILPLVIKGTNKALPVGGWCDYADIELVIGEPIFVSPEYKNIKESPAIEKVRDFYQKNI